MGGLEAEDSSGDLRNHEKALQEGVHVAGHPVIDHASEVLGCLFLDGGLEFEF